MDTLLEPISVKPTVEVQVLSEYLPDNSQPDANLYAFAYHVNIVNKGEKPAKLVGRHWVIMDGDQQVEEVKGVGVVGEQPLIQPGQTFKYSSGAILRTPVGSMYGSYRMLSTDGTTFEAPIQPFTLAHPRALH